MSVLINLLPDQLQADIASKRQSHLVTAIAGIVSAVAVGSMILLFIITQAQGYQLANLQKKIDGEKQQISSTEGLQAIFTIQSHLNSLGQLYAQRAYMTKVFSLLSTAAPTELSISSFTFDADRSIHMSGLARSYYVAAQFAKSMEAAKLPDGQPAVSAVTLADLSSGSGSRVSFNLTATLTGGVTNAN